jgi:AcrR family transcriptional regulator
MAQQSQHTDPQASEGVPDPPWWGPPRRASRRERTPLSRDAIVEAALRVLDEGGLEALSMRRVAEDLGAGAASLYWHVASKEQLLTFVLDRVIAEIPLPERDPERWQEQIRQFARDGRAAFLRYRDVARASMGRMPEGPNFLRVVEWQLALLHEAGIPPRATAWFGDVLALYVGAHALEHNVGTPEHMSGEQAETMFQDYMASLPPEQFPTLLALMPDVMAGDAEERFEFGLDLLIGGLEAMAPKRRTRRGR